MSDKPQPGQRLRSRASGREWEVTDVSPVDGSVHVRAVEWPFERRAITRRRFDRYEPVNTEETQ